MRFRPHSEVLRRAGVLFEVIVALVLFVGAASFVLSANRSVFSTLERTRLQREATDLARTRLAELEAGLITPETTVLSTGEFFLPNQPRGYRDWKPGGHGRVALNESMAQSVNTYYFQLAYDLGFDGPVFAFSWPSRERLFSYIGDGDSARLSAPGLREFLETVVAETKARRIHIIAHSMGNEVLNLALGTIDPDTLRKLNVGEMVDSAIAVCTMPITIMPVTGAPMAFTLAKICGKNLSPAAVLAVCAMVNCQPSSEPRQASTARAMMIEPMVGLNIFA